MKKVAPPFSLPHLFYSNQRPTLLIKQYFMRKVNAICKGSWNNFVFTMIRQPAKCRKCPAVRKCLTKYLCRNLFLYLAGSFCYLMYWSAILFTYCLQKHFASRDCPPQLFVTMCGTMRSLKSTDAASFIFNFNLHRKFLFCQEEKYIF
jgi:hypothetical protein